MPWRCRPSPTPPGVIRARSPTSSSRSIPGTSTSTQRLFGFVVAAGSGSAAGARAPAVLLRLELAAFEREADANGGALAGSRWAAAACGRLERGRAHLRRAFRQAPSQAGMTIHGATRPACGRVVEHRVRRPAGSGRVLVRADAVDDRRQARLSHDLAREAVPGRRAGGGQVKQAVRADPRGAGPSRQRCRATSSARRPGRRRCAARRARRRAAASSAGSSARASVHPARAQRSAGGSRRRDRALAFELASRRTRLSGVGESASVVRRRLARRRTRSRSSSARAARRPLRLLGEHARRRALTAYASSRFALGAIDRRVGGGVHDRRRAAARAHCARIASRRPRDRASARSSGDDLAERRERGAELAADLAVGAGDQDPHA